MNKNFNQRERDVVKLASFFKKQSVVLVKAGKLGEEHKKVEEAVDHFLLHLNNHADTRAFVLEQREYLNKLVKDNAVCPKCQTNEKLKIVGIEKNDKGWKSNRYKCRKCNIEFTWNTPNNPWHMIEYIEEMLQQMQSKAETKKISGDDTAEISQVIAGMQTNLEKLKPVIDAHEKDYHDLQVREQEMERLLHEFKNSLLIEKIKMDTWENKQQSKHK
jgi:transposase-like protein